MKLVLKIFIWVGVIIAGVGIVSLVLFVNSLPSVSEIRHAVNSSSEAPLQPPQLAQSAPVAEPSKVGSAQEMVKPETDTEAAASAANKKQAETAMLRSLIEDSPEKAEVCKNLGNAPNYNYGRDDTKNIEGAFGSLFSEEGSQNPYAQAFRVPLAHIFNRPLMKSLFQEILEFEETHPEAKDSLADKIGFYGKVSAAVADLIANKTYFEQISDHSYNLFVISQAVAKKPELARDPRVLKFCEDIEAEVKAGELSSLDEEREEVLALLDYAGVKPEEIGFDPSKRMKFEAKVDKHNFSIGIGNNSTN